VGKKEIIFILSSNWPFEFGSLKTSKTFPLKDPNIFNIKKINFLFKNTKGKIKKKYSGEKINPIDAKRKDPLNIKYGSISVEYKAI